MQTDLLKRLGNTLGDCMTGPIRTLKTGDLADVLYDAHEEIERLRASEAKLREALEKIAENEWVGGIGEAELYEGWREVAKKRGDIARAALGKEKK